ncbi:MAG: hypothetical protein N4A61_12000 [Pelagimonas sp.]|nr:hypothetical protein [Pelagimonas sp.]
MSKRVLVVGDGPAGHLAALILCNAGARVSLAMRPSVPNAHDRHVHLLPATLPTIAREIDEPLGQRLVEQQIQDWIWHSWASGHWDSQQATRISRKALMQALVDRVRGLSVAYSDGRTLRFEAGRAAFVDQWQSYDLCVDASGNSRITLPMLAGAGIDLLQSEMGGAERFTSLFYHRPMGMGCNQTWIYRSVEDPCQSAYLQAEPHGVTVTCSGTASHGTTAPDQLRATWHETPLCDVLPPDTVPRMRSVLVSPPVRQVQLAPGAGASSLGWIAFGDALLQLPVQSGFGLTSLMYQGLALKTALNTSWAPAHLRSALDRYARATALQIAGAMTLAGALPAGANPEPV